MRVQATFDERSLHTTRLYGPFGSAGFNFPMAPVDRDFADNVCVQVALRTRLGGEE